MVYFIHHILTNVTVHSVGIVLYIMDLINARRMEHIKISIMQLSIDAITLFLHTSIYFWGLLVEVMRTKFPMDQAGKEPVVKSHLNYCMDFGNLFFINKGPIRILANLSNVVILKQPKTVKDATDVMDTFHCLQLKPLKVLENGKLLAKLWIIDRLLSRRTVKSNEYCQSLPNDYLNTFLHI